MEKRIAHYEIAERIGAGGMGEVFRARDTTLGRDVALKVLPQAFAADPERLGRFKREAKLLASLNHPNIATLHGLEESAGHHFLVMELVEGEDLAQRLARGALPLREALKIARDVADALQAAHAQGVVHRDLKPANVRVTPEGKVKVLDFGLAKAMEADPSRPDLSQSPTIATAVGTMGGMILGTAAYMSPEQARGKPVDRLTDVWALGCLLFELLTGAQAFPGETVSDTIARILEREPEWGSLPADTPPGVQRLLRRCLQKDKSIRLQDAGEVRVEIDAVLSGTSEVWMPAPAARAGSVRARRLWMVATVILAAATAAFAIAYFGAAGRTPPLVRSSILPPDGSRFLTMGDFAGPVAISPDGSQLTFAANNAEGKRVLWLREIGSLHARALPGTEEATFPFWSPDGRSIGYFTDTRLMRVETAGGLPVSICDAPNGRGGTWNRDGVILLSPDFYAPIHRVPASGGVPVPVTTIDEAIHSTHRWPEFMPDGAHFVYLAAHHDASKSAEYALYFASLDGAENRRLFPTRAGAVYASGRLLYLRESTLMAERFDGTHGVLEGDPVALTDNVQYDPTTWRAALSASANGVLAYHVGEGSPGRTRLVVIDRTGKELQSIEAVEGFYSISLSPNGKRVAYTSQPREVAGSDLDVWICELDTDVRTRLTFQTGADITPIWSPDGNRVAYATLFPGDGTRMNELSWVNARGGDDQVLFSAEDEVWLTDWTADGRYLIFCRGNFAGNNSTIWALDLEGRRPFAVTAPADSFANGGAVSPDGRWIAFLSFSTGRTGLYIVPFRPRPLEEVVAAPPTPRWQVTTAVDAGMVPLWHRSGRELYYTRSDGTLYVVKLDASDVSLRVGSVEVLCHGPEPWNLGGIPYAATADADRFVVSTFSKTATPPIVLVQNWTHALER
ncbi:MAG: serine/threonine-protein kinase [Candidatus Krumholzibacteria bacterium]|nr:serine/threonine-protein kinase [Candidatus Krumholzibacteria bacterium]